MCGGEKKLRQVELIQSELNMRSELVGVFQVEKQSVVRELEN